MTSCLGLATPLILPLHSSEWAQLLPEMVFSALSDDPTLFWLDSGDSRDRWSYLGVAPFRHIPPAVFLKQPAASHEVHDTRNTPPFASRTLVQLNYPSAAPPYSFWNVANECMRIHQFQNILAYSHSARRWFSISERAAGSANLTDDFVHRILIQCQHVTSTKQTKTHYNYKRHEVDMHYLWAIQCALNYIEAGDIYQINISKKFSVPWRHASAQLYIRMRAKSPAAFGAYLGPGLTVDGKVICCISPELFLHVTGNTVLTRPIKGTRALGATALETAAARDELESNSKERAELNMIVDLERNDLGRVCDFGSVRVDSPGEIEALPTLLHRTATVSGRLRPGTTMGELLEATFPGGSVTGAPKIRAMQLIPQLESQSRGAYCGAIGWAGLNGGLELNIAIRTAVVDTINGMAHYYAGSGIVADSDPAREFEETLLKAAPFFQAIAEEGSMPCA